VVERPRHDRAGLFGWELAEDLTHNVDPPLLNGELLRCGLRAHALGVDTEVFPSPSMALAHGATFEGRDMQRPGEHPATARVVLTNASIDLEEGLLRRILRVVLVAQGPRTEGEKHRPQRGVERPKSTTVATRQTQCERFES